MEEVATPGSPKISPSGQYKLVVFEAKDRGGFPMNGFRIEDLSGNVLFTSEQHWSTRHRLYFLWDAENRVWVYSSDVGTSIWELADGRWQRKDHDAQAGLKPPDFLKRAVPRQFP